MAILPFIISLHIDKVAIFDIRLSGIKDIKQIDIILRRHQPLGQREETHRGNILIPEKVSQIVAVVTHLDQPQGQVYESHTRIHQELPLQSVSQV